MDTSSSSASEDQPGDQPCLTFDLELMMKCVGKIRCLKPGVRSAFCNLKEGSVFATKIMATSPLIFEKLNYDQKIFMIHCGPNDPKYFWVTTKKNISVYKEMVYDLDLALRKSKISWSKWRKDPPLYVPVAVRLCHILWRGLLLKAEHTGFFALEKATATVELLDLGIKISVPLKTIYPLAYRDGKTNKVVTSPEYLGMSFFTKTSLFERRMLHEWDGQNAQKREGWHMMENYVDHNGVPFLKLKKFLKLKMDATPPLDAIAYAGLPTSPAEKEASHKKVWFNPFVSNSVVTFVPYNRPRF